MSLNVNNCFESFYIFALFRGLIFGLYFPFIFESYIYVCDFIDIPETNSRFVHTLQKNTVGAETKNVVFCRRKNSIEFNAALIKQ